MNDMKGSSCLDDLNTLSSSSLQSQIHQNGRNVFSLLARRELSPRTKCSSRRQWGEAPKQNPRSSFKLKSEAGRDSRRELLSWVEAESLRYLSAKYCPLVPSPRSTIAAAFSPDGKTLASTHGDHTVKIIDCQTGSCEEVLSGHRRTPWVVRFHPVHPEILASGSLDHEVRLWNANTSECIGSRDFYRPIASIAFHAEGELLAVAAGHKLYLWQYGSRGENSSPTIVLRTRRSLRAVHFHPQSAPFLLTAEVNDLDSSDSTMAPATSLGYLHYPPPAVYMGNMHSMNHLSLAADLPLMPLPSLYSSSFARDDSRPHLQVGNTPVDSSSIEVESSAPLQFHANAMEPYGQMMTSTEMCPSLPSNVHASVEDSLANINSSGIQSFVCGTSTDAIGATALQLLEGHRQSSAMDTSGADNSATWFMSHSSGVPRSIPSQPDRASDEFRQDVLRDRTCWELPFLQGWLMGQSQAGIPSILPFSASPHEYSAGNTGAGSTTFTSDLAIRRDDVPSASLAIPSSTNRVVPERSGLREHSSHASLISATEFGQGSLNIDPNDGDDSFPAISRIQSQLSASLSATAAAELPCTVKLRIWPHDLKNPCAPLKAERCRLTIPHVVLCSEMGAHFSPCGRFLAACVACVLPQFEADPGLQTQLNQEVMETPTSPTRHPISARQVMYELRIYSLEESTFGSVLISRAIRAAHCLTSIQFSPTSEHILLAYGRRHSSLLKSIVINGETSLSIYTVLEVYRVSDMELVSVLPSAEDEVNVACFHPMPGGGLVYGTKEGKLRVLQYNGARDVNIARPNPFSEANMVEVQTYALEC